MTQNYIQYLKDPIASSHKARKHIRKLITEPHRIRAWFFYLLHPSYTLFTPDATRFLYRYLKPDMRVFEWGAGRSTLFFSQRLVTLVSIENNPIWHRRISARLARFKYSRVDLKLVEPINEYIKAIEAYPDNYFDLVTVDGREREACLLAALPKIKPGGKLFLDDSQRERYHPAMAEVEQQGWATTHFPYGFNRTTMWTKPLL